MAVSSVTVRNLAGTGCTGIGQRKEVCTTSQDERQSHRNCCQHHFLCCTLMVSVKTLKAERSLASGLVSSQKRGPIRTSFTAHRRLYRPASQSEQTRPDRLNDRPPLSHFQ